MTEEASTIGAAVKTARTAAGMSQLALANAAGCTQAHISDIESGRREPSLRQLRAIARALSLPAGSLLSEAA